MGQAEATGTPRYAIDSQIPRRKAITIPQASGVVWLADRDPCNALVQVT